MTAQHTGILVAVIRFRYCSFGLMEGIELGIGLRFGDQGIKLMPFVREIREVERLKEVKDAVKTARDLEAFEAAVKGERVH